VKAGDNLIGIAKSFNTTVADLRSANSLSNDAIRQGQILNLPGAGTRSSAESTPVKKVEAPKAASRSYTVKSGDRLIFIAKKFNVSPEELIAFNKISDPSKLRIGQTLKIPAKK
jgi:LysM repeat protein